MTWVVIKLFCRTTTLNQVHLDASCFIECGDFEDEASPRVLLSRQMSGTLKHLFRVHFGIFMG